MPLRITTQRPGGASQVSLPPASIISVRSTTVVESTALPADGAGWVAQT
jgi:hypothetical protein